MVMRPLYSLLDLSKVEFDSVSSWPNSVSFSLLAKSDWSLAVSAV